MRFSVPVTRFCYQNGGVNDDSAEILESFAETGKRGCPWPDVVMSELRECFVERSGLGDLWFVIILIVEVTVDVVRAFESVVDA